MQLFHTHFNNSFRNLLQTNFWRYERSVWLHMLAQGLISVFIATLLFSSGYTLGQIIWYYFFFYLFDIPLNYLSFYLVTKIGARKVIVLAVLFKIAFFIILGSLAAGGGGFAILVLLALFDAFYDTLYYVPHFFIFMKTDGSEDTRGNTGILYAVQRFAGFLGPGVGALLLIFVSENALIYAVIALFALSLLPLLRLKNFDDKPKCDRPRFRSLGLGARESFSSIALWGIHGKVENDLIPLFIFIVIGTIESVAIIPMLVSATAILMSYFVGKTKYSFSQIITRVAPLVLVIWILRIFIANNIFYYVTIIIVSFASLLISIPIDSEIFKIGKQHHPLCVAMYRNLLSMIGGVVLFGLLVIMVNVFHTSFAIAAVALLGLIMFNSLILMRKKSGEVLSQVVPE